MTLVQLLDAYLAADDAALSEWLRQSARGHRSGRAVVFSFKDGGWRMLRSWSVDVAGKAAA